MSIGKETESRRVPRETSNPRGFFGGYQNDDLCTRAVLGLHDGTSSIGVDSVPVPQYNGKFHSYNTEKRKEDWRYHNQQKERLIRHDDADDTSDEGLIQSTEAAITENNVVIPEKQAKENDSDPNKGKGQPAEKDDSLVSDAIKDKEADAKVLNLMSQSSYVVTNTVPNPEVASVVTVACEENLVYPQPHQKQESPKFHEELRLDSFDKTVEIGGQVLNSEKEQSVDTNIQVPALHWRPFSQMNAGMGMGMGFGMGMVDMLQVPPLHGGQFPYSPIAAHSSVPMMGGISHQMFGHPDQRMHMSMPCAPFIPHSAGPSTHPTLLPVVSGVATCTEIPNLTMPSSSNRPIENVNFELSNRNAECQQNQTSVQFADMERRNFISIQHLHLELAEARQRSGSCEDAYVDHANSKEYQPFAATGGALAKAEHAPRIPIPPSVIGLGAYMQSGQVAASHPFFIPQQGIHGIHSIAQPSAHVPNPHMGPYIPNPRETSTPRGFFGGYQNDDLCTRVVLGLHDGYGTSSIGVDSVPVPQYNGKFDSHSGYNTEKRKDAWRYHNHQKERLIRHDDADDTSDEGLIQSTEAAITENNVVIPEKQAKENESDPNKGKDQPTEKDESLVSDAIKDEEADAKAEHAPGIPIPPSVIGLGAYLQSGQVAASHPFFVPQQGIHSIAQPSAHVPNPHMGPFIPIPAISSHQDWQNHQAVANNNQYQPPQTEQNMQSSHVHYDYQQITPAHLSQSGYVVTEKRKEDWRYHNHQKERLIRHDDADETSDEGSIQSTEAAITENNVVIPEKQAKENESDPNKGKDQPTEKDESLVSDAIKDEEADAKAEHAPGIPIPLPVIGLGAYNLIRIPAISSGSTETATSKFHKDLRLDSSHRKVVMKLHDDTTANEGQGLPTEKQQYSADTSSLSSTRATSESNGSSAVLSPPTIPSGRTPSVGAPVKVVQSQLLDERSLLGCIVPAISAGRGGRVRISSTLPNRLGKMLAPLHWNDYRKLYGKLDDFVVGHPEKQQHQYGVQNKGTTVIFYVAHDFVIMLVETRETFMDEYIVNEHRTKYATFGQRIIVAFAGHILVGEEILEKLKALFHETAKLENITVDEFEEALLTINPLNNGDADIAIVGPSYDGGFHYRQHLFHRDDVKGECSFTKIQYRLDERVFCIGGGGEIAQKFIGDRAQSGNMTLENSKALLRSGMAIACTRDMFSGGNIRTIILRRSESFHLPRVIMEAASSQLSIKLLIAKYNIWIRPSMFFILYYRVGPNGTLSANSSFFTNWMNFLLGGKKTTATVNVAPTACVAQTRKKHVWVDVSKQKICLAIGTISYNGVPSTSDRLVTSLMRKSRKKNRKLFEGFELKEFKHEGQGFYCCLPSLDFLRNQIFQEFDEYDDLPKKYKQVDGAEAEDEDGDEDEEED